MADFTKFTSPPITSFSYDVAVEGADEAAKAQAVAAFGNSDYQVGGAAELKVKFYDDGTYTATATTGSPTRTVSGGYTYYHWTGNGSITA